MLAKGGGGAPSLPSVRSADRLMVCVYWHPMLKDPRESEVKMQEIKLTHLFNLRAEVTQVQVVGRTVMAIGAWAS